MPHSPLPRFTFFICAHLFLIASAFGQGVYTVRAGVFRDVHSEEFKAVKDLGYVYSLDAGERETEVFIGQFIEREEATRVAETLGERGFRNAQVQHLPAGAGQPLSMIQFALHDNRAEIPWQRYEALGQLHARSVDNTIKLFVGPFDDADAARAALSAVKQAGFTDAFVKTVPSLHLIKIDAFETNIKKPLIPIKYVPGRIPATGNGAVRDSSVVMSPQNEAPPAAPTPASYGSRAAVPPPNPAPATAPLSTIDTASAPATVPAPATSAKGVSPPDIDPATKRHSIAELQTALKRDGYYTASIDGLYGPGTTAAYRKAWTESPEIRKYRTLTGAGFAPKDDAGISAARWPEVVVARTIAADLAAGQTDQSRDRALTGQRADLFTTKEPLNRIAAASANAWADALWENLAGWAEEDPLHDRLLTAFRATYFQSQARLEQYYTDRGFPAIESRDLATAMMQNLIGAQLERFL